MKLSDVADPNRPPRKVVVVSPDAFADEWARKPTADVAIGLRLLSESDVQAARGEAAQQAVRWFADLEGECIDEDARTDPFNDGLIRHALARACTDPNNQSIAWFGEAAEDTVRVAL